MTTDITELAQREKFEAWWERTQHNGNPPRFGWSRWRDGEGYKVDDDDSELDGMWEAWKAAGAELVEALEKAQATEAHCNRGWIEAHEQEARAEAAEQRIAELESRTVKLPNQTEFDDPLSAYEAIKKCKEALTAEGIKWEAE